MSRQAVCVLPSYFRRVASPLLDNIPSTGSKMASAVTEKDPKQDGTLTSEHFDDGHPEKIGADNAIVPNNDLGMTNEDYEIAEKKLVRKLDLTLVPMVWLLYLFNYLDRNNIAYVFARLKVRGCRRPEANS